MAAIVTASPSTSCLTIVEIVSALDDNHRSKCRTPYEIVYSNRRDAGEDGMDELIWEFENCEVEWINIRSKKLVREFVPRLV